MSELIIINVKTRKVVRTQRSSKDEEKTREGDLLRSCSVRVRRSEPNGLRQHSAPPLGRVDLAP